MRLGAEVQNLLIVCVIDVRKHPQELSVHCADRGGEGGVKRLICEVICVRKKYLSGGDGERTGFSGEDILVIYKILNGGHDVVDVCRRGVGHLSTPRIRP